MTRMNKVVSSSVSASSVLLMLFVVYLIPVVKGFGIFHSSLPLPPLPPPLLSQQQQRNSWTRTRRRRRGDSTHNAEQTPNEEQKRRSWSALKMMMESPPERNSNPFHHQRTSTTLTTTSSPSSPSSIGKSNKSKKRHNISATAATATAAVMSAQWAFDELDDLYSKSSRIKCPFFRRRAADLIDASAMIVRFLLIRHKTLDILHPLFSSTLLQQQQQQHQDAHAHTLIATHEMHHHTLQQPTPSTATTKTTTTTEEEEVRPGCKAIGRHLHKDPTTGIVIKNTHLPLTNIANRIQSDWISGKNGHTGYYITGKLDSTIYRDDCYFTGPDPDMPVRGLRKYLSAASHLFDSMTSQAQLQSLSILYPPPTTTTTNNNITTTTTATNNNNEDNNNNNTPKEDYGKIVVEWKLSGNIMLPWRPSVRPWTGKTIYHLDSNHLIYHHEEFWNISVWQAFLCTVWPNLGKQLWPEEHQQEEVNE